MKTLPKTFLALVMVSAASPLFAQGEGNYQLTFDDLDTNLDGKVSQEEAQTGGLSADNFKQYDVDGDGYLTEEEVQPRTDTPEPADESGSGSAPYQ